MGVPRIAKNTIDLSKSLSGDSKPAGTVSKNQERVHPDQYVGDNTSSQTPAAKLLQRGTQLLAKKISQASKKIDQAFLYFHPEVREPYKEFKDPKSRAELTKMAIRAGENSKTLFKHLFPEIAELSRRRWDRHSTNFDMGLWNFWCKIFSGLENYAIGTGVTYMVLDDEAFCRSKALPDECSDPEMRLALYLMSSQYKVKRLKDGATEIIKEAINDPEMRWDLVKLFKNLGRKSRYFLPEGFANIQGEFRDPKMRAELIKMAQDVGELSYFIFRYAFSDIREEFRTGGYEGVRDYCRDFAEILSKTSYKGDFCKSIFHQMREELKNPEIRKDMVQLVKTRGYRVEDLFTNVILHLKEELKDPAMRAGLVDMVDAAGDSSVLYAVVSHTSEEFKDSKMRDDLVKMAKVAGGWSKVLFKHAFPLIRGEFRENGYEGIKEYWLTLRELMKYLRTEWELQRVLPVIHEDMKEPGMRKKLIQLAQISKYERTMSHNRRRFYYYSGEFFVTVYPQIRDDIRAHEYNQEVDSIIKSIFTGPYEYDKVKKRAPGILPKLKQAFEKQDSLAHPNNQPVI